MWQADAPTQRNPMELVRVKGATKRKWANAQFDCGRVPIFCCSVCTSRSTQLPCCGFVSDSALANVDRHAPNRSVRTLRLNALPARSLSKRNNTCNDIKDRGNRVKCIFYLV